MYIEQYKPTFLKRALEAIMATLAIAAFSMLITFTMINFILGCETWDYWTETNSCITPAQIFGLIKPN